MIGRVPEDGEELFRAWERALDALERDVLRAEHLVADPAGAARVPSCRRLAPTGFDGTIPATLVERAGGLLRRRAGGEKLAALDARSRRPRPVRRTAPAARAAGPAYLDISA